MKRCNSTNVKIGWAILLIVILAIVSEFFLYSNNPNNLNNHVQMRNIWEGMTNTSDSDDTSHLNDESEMEEHELNEAPTQIPKQENSRCPDMLIQEGGAYYLLNSKKHRVPGVNPVRLSSLEEYKEFVEWQRMNNIRCPILYVQHMLGANGESIYKNGIDPLVQKNGYMPSIVQTVSQDVQMRDEASVRFDRNYMEACGEGSVLDPQFCKNSSTILNDGRYRTTLHNNVAKNESGVYSYDPMNQYIGVRTAVDRT